MTENVVKLFKGHLAETDTSPYTRPTAAPDLVKRPAKAPLRVRAGRVVRAVATDERTLTTGRLVVRHTMYVSGGARTVAKRTWDGRTAARYERLIRAAEAAGNFEQVSEWEERGQRYREARHRRRMDLLKAPVQVAKGAGVAAGTTLAALVGVGTALAVATGDPADVLAPTGAVIDLIHWAFIIGTLVWGPLLMVAPALGLLSLWSVGRRHQSAPQWALPNSQRSNEGEPITPSIVVTALRDLGISALRKAVQEMGDAGAAMLSPIKIAGCGVEVDAHLPSGVSTEEVQNRRRKLAENLNRHMHEVFISIPPQPRTVRLWIADSGALDEPIGASPLVTDPGTTADYRTGSAPWGQDLRGDAALINLFQKHLLITGLSNQGKTASLRALALWLAHDIAVEFRIADLKGVGDWDCMDGIATVLIEGPTDEQVIDATHMAEDAVFEMNRRLAAKDTTSHPLVLIVDEAQIAYGSGAVGLDKRPYGGSKATSRYFQAVKSIHDQGRAVNVTIWEGTQDPTNENLPKRSREGNHIRASLVVGTEEQAKMALGDKAVSGGAAPHQLRQGLDKGTLVVAGDGVKLAPGQSSITIRTHYIEKTEADGIADRIRARRSGVTTLGAVDTAEPADHLADIAEVLGNQERMRTDEVRQRLAQLNPGEYREWTASALTQALEPAGAQPYKSNGVMVVSRARVQEALAERRQGDDEA